MNPHDLGYVMGYEMAPLLVGMFALVVACAVIAVGIVVTGLMVEVKARLSRG